WRDGHYDLPPFSHPALRFQARNVEMLPPAAGGGMVISLRGAGLLIRDQNGRFTHLTTKDGLTADWLSDLDISPEGVIYACSNTGLNILTRPPDGHWRIETFTAKHGLPSNRVNDVALLGNEIWVATDQGIARFREKPAPVPIPAPFLEKFVVNNRDTVFAEHLHLAHDQNNIALRFFALHFRSGGIISYRYRLLGGDTSVVYTHTREVNFANLSPRIYTFEVQAQNEDGQWSEPSRWSFEIRPPWWATWWCRAFVGVILAVALWLFYRSRVRQIRRDAALREKVRDLETAALRAQMNPHFIFNCLQSIQAFIARNDRDAAASYLARFAKLVRLALHGSVNGQHSLSEEMAMLENYLYLEQLRFGDKFEFVIHTEPGLDPEDITLPPLLVQPFVENALVHGLKGRENGGRVEVFFSKKGDLMEVVVTDNGTGFSNEKDESKAGLRSHKSVGMMLTQKRLDLLVGVSNSGEARLARETMRDVNGTAIGACVRILIPSVY
ncbi:MAG: histidine kinase, partial [Saprospiraceae bacterium]